jgi:hypothetical protein
MRTYIVYDRESGKIVHRHRQDEKVEAALGAKKERILSLVKPSHDRERLEVLVLEKDDMQQGKAYRVNPKTKTLEMIS